MAIFRHTFSNRNISSCKFMSIYFHSKSVFSKDSTNQGEKRNLACKISSATSTVRAASYTKVLKPANMFSKEDQEEIQKVFPVIVRDLTKNENYSDVTEISKEFEKVLYYNIPLESSKTFGSIITTSYKMLEKPEHLTTENLFSACVLALCWEMLTACLLMEDDIYDQSETRRFVPCWYKIKNNPTVYNDINFIKHGAFIILNKYFSSHPFYTSMQDVMHTGLFNCTYSFALDAGKTLKLEDMTTEESLRQEKYTSAICAYVVPVGLGMCVSKVYSDDLFEECRDVLYELGTFFMIENAIWDVFADPNSTGKIGTDIELGKCRWMLLTALQKANTRQRDLIKKHYGKSEEESIQIIRNLYMEVDIIEFFVYRQKHYEEICEKIKIISHDGMRRLLNDLCKRLCLRKYLI